MHTFRDKITRRVCPLAQNAVSRERLLVYGQIDKAVCNKRGGVRYSFAMLMHGKL